MQRLWVALRRIPAGEVRSYAELGGDRRHARAAGTACARNPVALIVPCHRVVRADGSLGGFGWGTDVKRWLLDHETAAMERRLGGQRRRLTRLPDPGDQPGPSGGPPLHAGKCPAEQALLIPDPGHLQERRRWRPRSSGHRWPSEASIASAAAISQR